MTFFRPEAIALLIRWREVGIGTAAVLLGVWMILGPGSLMSVLGSAACVAGIALVWIGVQRGRFRRDGGGAGTVQVVEGQITYFGPLTGGTVALREIETLTLDGGSFPAHWALVQPGHPPLLIPVNAEGADALFDAYTSLPGIRTERMLAALRETPPHSVLIWQRSSAPAKPSLLH